MTITTVLFDVGGTLMDARGGSPAVYAAAAREVADFDRPEAHYDSTFNDVFAEHGEELFRHVPGRLVDDALEHDRWRRFSTHVFARLGLEAKDASVVCEVLIDRYSRTETWSLFPDSRPTIERLAKAGIRLGIISNWSLSLRRILEGHELIAPFETIVGSCEEGIEKPDPAIFQIALKRMKVTAAEVVYVGDSPSADITGARAAGIEPLLIDRSGRHPDRPERISTLLEVVDRIS